MRRSTDSKFGRYTLLRRLGRGGMAQVFLAKVSGPAEVEKQVVIKRIHPDLCRDPVFVNMFIDEARISVQLRHGNIVPVFDFGKVEDQYYLALEFVDGVTLADLLKACRAADELLPIELALFIAVEVCKGLHHAHRLKDPSGRPLHIVHRDVSPQNVMLSTEGEVKLLDFGIARAASRVTRTLIGEVKGKYRYMSPEQAQGLPVDFLSDIFSSGTLLYEMLTGQRLFDAESPTELVKLVQACQVGPPSGVNQRVPAGLDRLVLKALARDPKERYQSAEEFGGELSAELYRRSPSFLPKSLSDFVERFCPPGSRAELSWDEEEGSGEQAGDDGAAYPDTRKDQLPLEGESVPVPEPGPESIPEERQPVPPAAIPFSDASPTAPAGRRPSRLVLLLGRGRRRWITLAVLGAVAAVVVVICALVEASSSPPAPKPQQEASVAGWTGIPPLSKPKETPPLAAEDSGDAGSPNGEEKESPLPSKPPRHAHHRTGGKDGGTTAQVTPVLGFVQITSQPPADVYWKKQLLGRTPLNTLRLPLGTQVLTLENKELGIRKDVRIEVKVGQTASANVRLKK